VYFTATTSVDLDIVGAGGDGGSSGEISWLKAIATDPSGPSTT
tara:strand:+ start:326 stop:454 length:129 start_codon:yes stop_codon:yes gene_type:complete